MRAQLGQAQLPETLAAILSKGETLRRLARNARAHADMLNVGSGESAGLSRFGWGGGGG